MSFHPFVLIVLLLLLVTGCTRNLLPDFGQLYRSPPSQHDLHGNEAQHPPVIIVPGLLGSKLAVAQTGEELWPSSVRKLLFSRYERLELPLLPVAVHPTSVALPAVKSVGLTEAAFGRDFYGRLIRTLVEYGGYRRVQPGQAIESAGERRLYVFDYDWRQDNVLTAQRFHEFIQQVRTDYADPQLKVDVIAHSMGGLMSRYYLRYGTEDVLNDNSLEVTWAGAPAINKMILLGTPNLGSVSAIEGVIHGQKVGLRRIPQEVVATLPSAVQLFPHRIVNWLVSTQGKPIDLDPFDLSTWQTNRWSLFNPAIRDRVIKRRGQQHYDTLVTQFEVNLERARRFSWSLTVCPNFDAAVGGCGEVAEPPIKLVVFGGDCHKTPARWVMEDEGDERRIHFRVPRGSKVGGRGLHAQVFEPGDGTVTKPSLLARDALSPHTPRHAYSYFPLAYAFLLCEPHSTLTGNKHFQDNLLDLLLTRALPWELHKDHTFAQ